MNETGGFSNVLHKYGRAVPQTYLDDLPYGNASCGVPPQDFAHLFRAVDDSDYPWTGVILGLTISSIWYWCSDQVNTWAVYTNTP